MEHGMEHPRTLICHMHIILHTWNSKTCKVYSMKQFHNPRGSRVKGYKRGNSLIYTGRHTYHALQKAQCGQGLGNPMFLQCIWAYISSGQKSQLFHRGGGGPLSQSILDPVMTQKGWYLLISDAFGAIWMHYNSDI